MIDCQVLDRWDDLYGINQHLVVGLNEDGNDCVFIDHYYNDRVDDWVWKIISNDKGNEVYEWGLSPEDAYRYLTDEEREAVTEFVEEQWAVEDMMEGEDE